MPKIPVINISKVFEPDQHGTHTKHLFVVHETVSPDAAGLADILGVESSLRKEGYGVQGITDQEGHKAWTLSHSDWVLYHAGGVNSYAVGCEQVSYIPALIKADVLTHAQAHEHWLARTHQLTATAMLIAGWHNADKKNHPIRRSNGLIESPGVCSHWDVSQHYSESDGHWDCWPWDKGGYFPLQHLIDLATTYAAAGYMF